MMFFLILLIMVNTAFFTFSGIIVMECTGLYDGKEYWTKVIRLYSATLVVQSIVFPAMFYYNVWKGQ